MAKAEQLMMIINIHIWKTCKLILFQPFKCIVSAYKNSFANLWLYDNFDTYFSLIFLIWSRAPQHFFLSLSREGVIEPGNVTMVFYITSSEIIESYEADMVLSKNQVFHTLMSCANLRSISIFINLTRRFLKHNIIKSSLCSSSLHS